MIRGQFRVLVASAAGRGALAGALGGLVLTSMFLQAHGASLNRYALNRGNTALAYFIVWILAIAIGTIFGRLAGVTAGADLGYALSRGLLVGLGWFVLASCLVLPVLRGAHPFSFTPAVGSEVIQYLVYGMLLGVGYHQITELVDMTMRAISPQGRRQTSGGTAPVRRTAPQPGRRTAAGTQARQRRARG